MESTATRSGGLTRGRGAIAAGGIVAGVAFVAACNSLLGNEEATERDSGMRARDGHVGGDVAGDGGLRDATNDGAPGDVRADARLDAGPVPCPPDAMNLIANGTFDESVTACAEWSQFRTVQFVPVSPGHPCGGACQICWNATAGGPNPGIEQLVVLPEGGAPHGVTLGAYGTILDGGADASLQLNLFLIGANATGDAAYGEQFPFVSGAGWTPLSVYLPGPLAGTVRVELLDDTAEAGCFALSHVTLTVD